MTNYIHSATLEVIKATESLESALEHKDNTQLLHQLYQKACQGVNIIADREIYLLDDKSDWGVSGFVIIDSGYVPSYYADALLELAIVFDSIELHIDADKKDIAELFKALMKYIFTFEQYNKS